MRNKKSIRNRGKQRRKNVIDLDITSLLDILVIMLVFLLKSYNSSGVIFNIPKDIKLPESVSQSVNTSGVIVQVSPTTIWVDDKEVLKLDSAKGRLYDHGNKRIISLYNELVKKKELFKRVEKSAQNAKKFSGVVNLIVDKSIKYSFVKKILYTSAEAGYRQYKFVVMGENL